ELIAKNLVAVFSKSYCPYCVRAKRIISDLNLGDKVGIIELDHDKNGAAIQDYLQSKTGQRTVPNIFIKQEHVGGCSDLQSLQASGKLPKMVGQSS
ncbi:Glutaredoxin, partial [Tilletia horrida]